MATQIDIAREALAQIGTRSTIASLEDGSAEATYINLLYYPIRDFLLTEGDYDFSRSSIPLVESGDPNPPWAYSYEYPTDALRIRQLIPKSYNPLDPRQIEWIGTFDYYTGDHLIFTQVEALWIIYTKAVEEEFWDPIYHTAFVRMLASALAFALENRIEASKLKMDEALGFAGIGKIRDM